MLSSKLMVSVPQAIRVMRKQSSDCLNNTVTLQQLRVLVLVKEGFGPTQMADILQVSLAAISKMVSGLAKKKLIIRTEGKDKRCQRVQLTGQGKKILTTAKRHVEKKLNFGISQLTKDEQKDLEQGLTVLDKLISLVNEV